MRAPLMVEATRREDEPYPAPLLDIRFANGISYRARKTGTALAFSRASDACRYWRQPADLVGDNVPRHSADGILLEGGDTSQMPHNTVYDPTKWSIAGGMVVSDDTDIDLYDGHSFKLDNSAGGAADQLTANPAITLTQKQKIIQALVKTDGSPVTSADLELYASGEVVTNGGFEVDLTGWGGGGVGGGTGSVVRDIGTTHGGSVGSLKITHSNGVGYYRARQLPLTLVSNRHYNISYWVYIPSANVPSNFVAIGVYDVSNTIAAAANLGITDAWQQVTVSNWSPGLDAKGYLMLWVADYDGGGGAFVYFDDVSITEINPNLPTTFEHVGNGVYNAWGIFAGGANAFDLGIEVKANKTVYETLLTVYKASPSNEGGLFPRSHIPNSTAASITWAADVLVIPVPGNMGLGAGTIDIAFIASFAPAAVNVGPYLFTSRQTADTNRINISCPIAGPLFTHIVGGVSRSATGALAYVRGDRVKLRAIWDVATVDGTNYMILYGRINDGAWAQVGVGAVALAGTLPNIGEIVIGARYNDGTFSAASFISHVRTYGRAILNPTW